MKFYAILTFTLFSSILIAQKAKTPVVKTVNIKAEFNSPVADCKDPVKFFKWTGAMPEEVGSATVQEESGKAVLTYNLPYDYQGIYFVGKEPQQVSPFYINGESLISFSGNCNALHQLTPNSKGNSEYQGLNMKIQGIFNDFIQTIMKYREANGDPAKTAPLDAMMKTLDTRRLSLLDSLKGKNDFFHTITSLNTYLSYQHNKSSLMQTETHYFADNFLKFVPFNDEYLWRIPTFFDIVKNYTTNLSQIGLPEAEQIQYLDKVLAKMPKGSNNHFTAIFAIMVGYMSNDQIFVRYGKQYLELYKGRNAQMTSFVEEKVNQLKGKIPGEDIAEIKEVNPDGKTISTKDYKGKVLLIDFWASWCGPCRKINPHVVALYNKYKDKGFDVLGVSLDKNRDGWLAAIKQDGLVWEHVSDLGFWSSKWAKLYGVSSIPYAVLVDREGKLISAGIRPDQLEQELHRIFGF